MATVAGICSCQCTLPTNGDLELVIKGIIEADNASSTPTVNVMSFHPVCLAFDEIQDRYRAVSVMVNYTCTDNPSCSSGTAVEQIESECVNGQWSNVVRGVKERTRSQATKASFSTSTREDCSLCVSPELGAALSLVTDNVTHCVGECVTRHKCTLHRQLLIIAVYISIECHLSCNEGFMRCSVHIHADSCCNYYNNSMCVDECPSPFQPNTANECVCPPGTTGFNCTEGESRGNNVMSVVSIFKRCL